MRRGSSLGCVLHVHATNYHVCNCDVMCYQLTNQVSLQ